MERDDQARERPSYTPEEIARIERRDATVRRVAEVLGVEPTTGDDFSIALVTAAGVRYDWLEILDAHLRLIDGWVAAEAARVGPDDVLVIRGDFGPRGSSEIAATLEDLGLSRSLVIDSAAAQMTVAARDSDGAAS